MLSRLLPILTSIVFCSCAGVYAWGADEAGATIGTALSPSVRGVLDIASLALQPWVMLVDVWYRTNSLFFLIALEVVSALLLASVLLSLRRYGPVYWTVILLALAFSPALAYAGFQNYRSARDYDLYHYEHDATSGA